MPEIRCAGCGVRSRSAGQNPPPSWWQDPADPDTVLCQDCRELMQELRPLYQFHGLAIAPENVRAELALQRHRRARLLNTRPALNLSDRSEP